MFKIRLEGKKDEIVEAQKVIEKCKDLVVLNNTTPIANRGDSLFFRVYIDAELKEGK